MSDHSQTDGWVASVERFAAALVKEDRAPLTVRNYRRELMAFGRYHVEQFREPPDLAHLTEEDLRDYRDHMRGRKLKPATMALARSSLSQMMRWALAQRLIGEPIRPPRVPRQVRRVPRWLTKPQEKRLIKVVRKSGNTPHLGLIELMLVFGLRISEASSRTWGDVTMGRARAELRVYGKGSKERVLPFLGNERARDALLALGYKRHHKEAARPLAWGQRGPLTPSGIKQLLTPYGRAAGIEPFSAHVLRHTCAKRMIERGTPITTVASWMGHDSINTTMVYTLPSAEEMAAAAGATAEGWDDDD
jgi:site-specific recombinase XerD